MNRPGEYNEWPTPERFAVARRTALGRVPPFTGADSRQGRAPLFDARLPTLRYRRPAPLPPQRPRNRLFPCDTRDLSAEAALQHRPPGHQRELATLLDH